MTHWHGDPVICAGRSRLTPGQRRKAALIARLGVAADWRASVPRGGGGSRGCEHYDAVLASGHQPIIAFWHGRILPGMFFFRDRGIVVITSQNFDGEWIARIIQRFGYGTARGRRPAAGRARWCRCGAISRLDVLWRSPWTGRADPRGWPSLVPSGSPARPVSRCCPCISKPIRPGR